MRRARLLFDGDCCFCVRAARRLALVDFLGQVELVDFRRRDPALLDPRLTLAACETKIHLLEDGGRLTAGFAALRRLSLLLPSLWLAAPLLRLPGARLVGGALYERLARLRFAFDQRFSRPQ